MNIIKSFFQRNLPVVEKKDDGITSEGSEKKSLTPSKALSEALGGGTDKEYDITFTQMWAVYKRHAWVRAVVDLIVKQTCTVNPIFRPRRHHEGGIPVATKKNIDLVADFFDDPNMEKESFFQIRQKGVRDLMVTDGYCIEKVNDTDGDLAEIYATDSQYIRKNTNEKGLLNSEKAYVQDIDNGMRKKDQVWFKKDEMIYMMLYPKAGSIYGAPPIETLKNTVAADLFLDRHNLDFFQNNAMPTGVLGFEGMKKPALKKFADWWRAHLKGRPFKTAFVGTKPYWLDMMTNNRDMEFMDYARWMLSKVMSVYGMQPIVIGIRDVGTGRLNSVQQYEAFKNNAIKPILKLESYTYTKEIIQEGLGIDDVVFDFEDISRADVETQSNIDKTYVQNGIYTINEVREAKGMAPVPWGFAPFVAGQQTQDGAPIKPIKPMPPAKPEVTAEDKTQQKKFEEFQEDVEEIRERWEDMDKDEMVGLLETLFEGAA